MLFDDAQNINERARSKQFSFKSVGIQAQGRTTILKINYRNTRQILQTASLVAADLLTADDKDDDGIPMLKPVSCGREGQVPIIIKLPTLRDEAFAIADHLASAADAIQVLTTEIRGRCKFPPDFWRQWPHSSTSFCFAYMILWVMVSLKHKIQDWLRCVADVALL